MHEFCLYSPCSLILVPGLPQLPSSLYTPVYSKYKSKINQNLFSKVEGEHCNFFSAPKYVVYLVYRYRMHCTVCTLYNVHECTLYSVQYM